MCVKTFWKAFVLLAITWHTSIGEHSYPKDTTTTIKLGFVLPDGVHKLTVPFELNNNLVVIKVLLNNAIPLKFILDTGVRTTVLTEKTFTDLLNLNYSRKITIPGIGGEKLIDAFVTNNVTLQIDGMIGRGHAIIVLEKDFLQLKNYLGTSVHGILGYELFSRFIVEINYSNKTVTFYDPSYDKKRRRFKSYNMEIIDTKPYIQANFKLNDSILHKGKFMLDTGASHSFLLDSNNDPNIHIPQPNIYSHLGRGLGGDLFGYISRIDKVSIGPFVFKEVIATFPDLADYELKHDFEERMGTIGGGMLSRFVVAFDYVHGKLYLKKGSTFRKAFEYNLSGLVVKASGLRLDTYEIVEVRKGSAAEQAGVEVGDEILAINGQSTKEMTLDEVLGIINIKADRNIKMTLMRSGEKTKLHFRLERQV